MPLSPRRITPTPKMSTMLPISVPRGANIISSASVARLINFIVTIGHRKMGTCASSAAFRNSLSGCRLRENTRQGTLNENSVWYRRIRSSSGSDLRKKASAFPIACTRLNAKYLVNPERTRPGRLTVGSRMIRLRPLAPASKLSSRLPECSV